MRYVVRQFAAWMAPGMRTLAGCKWLIPNRLRSAKFLLRMLKRPPLLLLLEGNPAVDGVEAGFEPPAINRAVQSPVEFHAERTIRIGTRGSWLPPTESHLEITPDRPVYRTELEVGLGIGGNRDIDAAVRCAERHRLGG